MKKQSRGPLVALIAIVTISLTLTLREILLHQVTVRAADGSSVTIETDPSRLTGLGVAGDAETMRKYGVSPHSQQQQPEDLPEGTGREANLSGTKVR